MVFLKKYSIAETSSTFHIAITFILHTSKHFWIPHISHYTSLLETNTHTQIFGDQFVNRYHYLSRIHHSPRLSMTPTFSQMQIFKRSCLSCTRTFTSYKNFIRTYSRWGSVWGHRSKSLRPCLCTIKTN